MARMDYEDLRKRLSRQQLKNLRRLERLLIGDSYLIDGMRIQFTTGDSTARSFKVYRGEALVDHIRVNGLRDDKNAFIRVAMVKWLSKRGIDLEDAEHVYEIEA